MGIPSQLFFNLIEQFFNPPNLCFLMLRQFARDVCEREVHGHQKLSGLVMHGVSNALDLFLKYLIQLPQRRDRILNSTVRHFIRGENLCQEIGSSCQQFLMARRSLSIGQHRVENLMMQGSDFYEALFVSNGAPPKLVGAAQCSLATTLGVFS